MAKLTKEQVIQKVTQDIASKTEKNSISPGVLATIIIDAVQLINNVSEFDFVLDENNVAQGLTQGINVKEGITGIAGGAFSSYDRTYSKVTLPSTLKTIGYEAFYYNFIGGTLTIPTSVTLIEADAFDDNRIEEVIFEGTGPITLGKRAFGNNLISGVITVENRFTLDGQTFDNNPNITQVIFEEGRTSIGGFSGCSGITSVVVPSTAREILENGFRGSNVDVDLSNIEIIGPNGFFNSSISQVTFGPNLTTIGAGAYYACSNLTSLSFPASLTTIESSAFRSSGLTSISIPSSVTVLGNQAFRDAPLATLSIPPEKYAIMGSNVFEGCLFTSLDLTGATVIKDGTFRSNPNLTSVTFSSSITTIEGYAFYNCPGITSVDVPVGCDVQFRAFDGDVTINYVL